jgi:hypothetical protein
VIYIEGMTGASCAINVESYLLNVEFVRNQGPGVGGGRGGMKRDDCRDTFQSQDFLYKVEENVTN